MPLCFIHVDFSYFSVVKEEIIEDDAHLPCFNGRVVSWVSLKYYDPYFLLSFVRLIS